MHQGCFKSESEEESKQHLESYVQEEEEDEEEDQHPPKQRYPVVPQKLEYQAYLDQDYS